MIRITRSNIAHQRRKKILKLCKGYTGSNSRLSTYAGEQLIQSLNFAYKSRRLKKRYYRMIWIKHINSVLCTLKLKYSCFIGKLRKLNILLNRKMLALLAYSDLSVFNILIMLVFNRLF